MKRQIVADQDDQSSEGITDHTESECFDKGATTNGT